MDRKFIVQEEYRRDPKLRKENVLQIMNWRKCQPHLPDMTEQEVLWFLKSCYYNIESTKITIEKYFSMKTTCREFLGNRSLEVKSLKIALETIFFCVIPKRTPDGFTALLSHLMDANLETFNFNEILKIFDMVIMTDMFKNGSYDGLICCIDMKGISFSHVTRIGISTIKNFFYYLQECMPIRLKGLHFFNVTSVMDTLLKIMKPFMKKEVIEMVHLHQTVDGLNKFVPIEYLPSDFGGTYESLEVLHDRMKMTLEENTDFFAHQDKQLVDKSKRPSTKNSASHLHGFVGSFKKLELD